MTGIDTSTFTVRERGKYFEEFVEGQELVHHWGRTLTNADAALFNAMTVNYNPLYLNEAYAQSLGHPCAPLSPYLCFLTVLGLSVEDTSEKGGAFLGVGRVDFFTSVYPGDTLTAESRVMSVRASNSRPQHGIVTWQTTGRNQHGVEVLQLERTNLVVREEPL